MSKVVKEDDIDFAKAFEESLKEIHSGEIMKGIVAGIGGIAPGLSGSVLLVILGLYEQAVHAIGTLFLDFKKNIRFLLPLVAGFGAGILLFSKVVDYLLLHWELYTRFAFLGLIRD